MKLPKILQLALVTAPLAVAPLAAAQTAYAPPPADVQATELFKLGTEKRTFTKSLGTKFDTGRAEVFINAPVSTVKAAVTDYANYAKVIPKFQKAKVLKKSGATTDVYLMIPILKGAANVWSVQHFEAPVANGKGETVIGKSLQGNVDALNTKWTYRAVDATHTVLSCEIYVEPKLPVPGGTIAKEAQRAAAEAVVSVRAHAENASKKVAGVP
jgi:ribosome-associated toxin RatA of RatAB toxin-antitoxin module